MAKIAVMGAYDSIYGFAALGLETFPVQAHDEAKALLRRLAESDYAVIYMTESLVAELETEVAKFRSRMTPAIIPIPGVAGNTGSGVQAVKQSVEKAVGSDILFANQ